jgi:glycerol uptake facilitator-like aquaporin
MVKIQVKIISRLFMSFLFTLSRYAIREPAAEFLGTMIFVIFGTGVNCQVFLSMNSNVEAVPRGVSGCYQRLLMLTIQAHGVQMI